MHDATEIDTAVGTQPAHDSAPLLRRGLEIGRYVLLSELGAGGMGVV